MVFALLAAFAVRVAAVFILAFHCNGRSGGVIRRRRAISQGEDSQKLVRVLLLKGAI